MKGNEKGYRRTKNGRYEAYISDHCRYINPETVRKYMARYRKEKYYD